MPENDKLTTDDIAFHQMIGGIAADVKNILTNQIDAKEAHNRLSVRVTALEKGAWKQAGVITMIATTIPIVISLVGIWLSNKGA